MSIIVKEKSGPQVPPGTHIAVCYRIVDLGTQPDTGFGEREKIVIFWELPHELIEVDGVQKPMSISKFYTKSISKKAVLRKDLESWRGRDFTGEELAAFNMGNILGKACQLQIITSETGKSQVAAVVGLPKGTAAPKAFNPLVEWSVSQGRDATYNALPEWVRKMADGCIEWNSSDSASGEEQTEPQPVSDSDVPF